jgi:hypothetical protein
VVRFILQHTDVYRQHLTAEHFVISRGRVMFHLNIKYVEKT